jgi:hypothetical protein
MRERLRRHFVATSARIVGLGRTDFVMHHRIYSLLEPSRNALRLALLVFFALMGSVAIRAAKDDGRIHWKPIDRGQVRMDDKPPLASAVYQPDKSQKKPNLVLILLGHRWLALDIKTKLVYQVLPSDLQAEGSNFESGDLFTSEHLVPSKDWTMRDVGPAELVKLTLNDYGRELQVSLPHPADLRAFY